MTGKEVSRGSHIRRVDSRSARLHTISPMAIGTFGADNGLHSLVVSPVGAIQKPTH